MYIRQIIIQGFKSYKDQTVMEPFSPGHNVVVGRNGSGKSNFFWAIRFVLGDAYASMTREERQSLLHEGTGPATISAYVEVIFDNADNRFPTGKPELVLRRTIGLKKDEYSLDKKSITKTEVMNLLESAGFSRSNPYYIVPQGRITALTNSKDAERLLLLKEVAGTRVYEQRRLESVKIMEETDLKRQKITELLTTINERLQELEEEKEELAQFQAVDRDRRCLEWALHSRELDQVVDSLDALVTEEETALERHRQDQQELEDRLTAIKRIEGEVTELRQQADLLALEQGHLDQERQEKNERQVQLALSLAELEGAEAEVQQERAQLTTRVRDVEEEIAHKRAALEAMTPRHQEAMKVEQQVQQALAGVEQEREALRDKQGRQRQFRTRQERDAWLRQEIQGLEASSAEYRSQLEQCQAAQAELQQRAQAITAKMEGARHRLANIRGDAEKAERGVSEARATRNRLDEERKQLWRQDAKSTALLESLRDQQARARRALQGTVDRATSLGLENVAKVARKFHLAGVHGPVYELFTVDPSFEAAVEVVAGASLFHVVVDTDETASKLLTYLTKERLGRVTCMPLNRLAPRDVVYPQSELALPMIDQLTFDPAYRKAFQQIFGKALICPDLTTAAEFARTSGCNAVTLDGDRADRKGALTGGYADHKSSRLDLVKRLAAAEQALGAEERTATATKAQLNVLEQRITEARDAMSAWDAKKRAILASKDPLGQEVQACTKDVERCHESLAFRTQGQEGLEHALAGLARKREDLARELMTPFARALSEQDQQRLDALNVEVVGRSKTHARASQARAALEADKAKLEMELEQNLERVLETLQGKLEALPTHHGAAIVERRQQGQQLEADVTGLAGRLKTVRAELKQLRNRIQQATQEEEALKSAHEELASAFERATLAATKSVARRDMLGRKKEELLLAIRELGVLPDDAQARYADASAPTLMAKLQKVKGQLKQYSHVNKKAYEQFTTFTKQKESLHQRKGELDASATSIEELIQTLDARKEEAITHTFKQVAANFAGVWEKLVPAGAGSLTMLRRQGEVADSQAELAAHGTSSAATAGTSDQYVGVGISVSFQSKVDKGMVMSQLSGGQKSLVALALIFAIQQCDPAPFYLFDEIDAALDSQYRASVANMVHQLSRNAAQFITTTFRPELLQHADKFYGVTFQNKVSRIQCITKEEATSFVEDAIGQAA